MTEVKEYTVFYRSRSNAIPDHWHKDNVFPLLSSAIDRASAIDAIGRIKIVETILFTNEICYSRIG